MAFSRFTLDTSKLDDTYWALDGSPFPMNATGTASLNSLTATATSSTTIQAAGSATLGTLTATSTASVTNQVSATANLGALETQATATVSHQASGSAGLAGVVGVASAVTVRSAVAVAGLGVGVGLATSLVLVRPFADGQLGSMVGSAQATVVPQPPAPPPSYPLGGNPWYRQPKVPVEKVSVVSVEVELPRVPERIVVSGSSVVSLSASATGEVAWSILEDEAELLLLV
jgi:hypothetical protein